MFVDIDRSPPEVVTAHRTSKYDAKTDTLTLELSSSPVTESDEDKPGVIPDYDAAGSLVSIEILDASRRVEQARSMQFQVAG